MRKNICNVKYPKNDLDTEFRKNLQKHREIRLQLNFKKWSKLNWDFMKKLSKKPVKI